MAFRILQSFCKYAKPPSNLSKISFIIPKNLSYVSHNLKQNPFQKKKLTPFSYFLLIIPGATFYLGCWQVQRRQWKLDIIKNLEQKISEPPVELSLDPSKLSDMEYRRVAVKGTFDHSKEMLLGPRPVLLEGKHKETGSLLSSGGSGFLVVTPFKLSESGETILVNRGWVDKRHINPNKRLAGQVTDEQEFSAVIRLQETRNPFMPKSVGVEKSFLYRDIETMSSMTNSLPIYVDACEGVEGGPHAGQTRISIRNEHLSYMLTWYSLSLITSCLWYRRYINPKAFL